MSDYTTDQRVTLPVEKEVQRLKQMNQELVEALEEIAEWTERYTSVGHPISTVARAILAKHRGQV